MEKWDCIGIWGVILVLGKVGFRDIYGIIRVLFLCFFRVCDCVVIFVVIFFL